MSRHAILHRLLADGKLYVLSSIFTGDDTVRTMIVTPEVLSVVSPPFADTFEGTRFAEFRAWLDAFMEGAEISVAEDPDGKPPEAMFARVHPTHAELWSIRVTEPKRSPGIRCFGAFHGQDTFIALTYDLREAIDDFDNAVDDAIQMWSDYFGSEAPFSGDSLDEYLTNYFAC
jgi:hypothetical protein